jgi:hypothetical protein
VARGTTRSQLTDGRAAQAGERRYDDQRASAAGKIQAEDAATGGFCIETGGNGLSSNGPSTRVSCSLHLRAPGLLGNKVSEVM